MSKFKKRYKVLNKEQKQAVDTVEGPVLVVAGPGSGKTEILGLRVANILKETDVLPGNILCLTFTDSAAANMRERLKDLMGPDAYKVAIHTFHGFGRDIRNYHPEIFYERDIFTAADDLTQRAVLEDIFKELPYDNPLSKTHPERGFIYLKHAKDAIEYLKKAGITVDEFSEILDHNEESLKLINPIIEDAFGDRISKALFKKIPKLLKRLEGREVDEFPVGHMESLVSAVLKSLGRALQRAVDEDKTSPLTQWKKDWTYKTKEGKRALKASKYMEKMRALSGVYREYKNEMRNKGYYDFDDMILDVIEAIETHDELRYELQEQFQYILVDEFQDTNDAQMRLLSLLTEHEVNEGRPNIMVVGDDDQAIFKFQGAEISNIIKFKDRYRDPEIVTLTKNYRSRQDILDAARYIITQGDERLENSISEVDKTLESGNDDIAEGEIVSKSFPDRSHEYYWIAKTIKSLIDDGTDPKEIAVIAREHKQLKAVLSHLSYFNIPVSYEKQRDVLKEPHIRQLITMVRFVTSIMDERREKADHLMSEILAYPFWGADREEVWRISRKAYKTRRPWMECMKESDNEKIRKIADFFLELSSVARHEPLERVLDKMVGARGHVMPASDDQDIEKETKKHKGFVSPFKEYYFGKRSFEEDPVLYLEFLSSLRTFIYALREYKQGEMIDLFDLVDFVDIHKNNKMSLPDKSAFASSRNAVNLLTAHGAKGLEFDSVFVLNCVDDVWAGRRRGSYLPFPQNLPIAPPGDTRDDQLRLFYVALTRAARCLYLTSYEYDSSGKEKARLEFLAPPEEGDEAIGEMLEPDSGEGELKSPEVEKEVVVSSWQSYHHPPFEGDEKVLLETILDDYKLNATHLNNFLNVHDGGPQKFLEDNLLRFPQPKAAPLSFGTAMHSTLNQTYKHLKKQEEMASSSQVLDWFEEFLYNQRLGDQDFKTYLKRGKDALKLFFEEKGDSFDISDFSEFNFKNEGVVISDVPLSGKIDKMVLNDDDDEIIVYDFKTGSPLNEWDKGSVYDKIKSWKYKNQLVFYKLLVENSRKFGDKYSVNRGVVEFLEPDDGDMIELIFDIEEDQVERLKTLIEKVYERIMNLDFPDIGKYDESIKGVKEFEEDLLEGNI